MTQTSQPSGGDTSRNSGGVRVLVVGDGEWRGTMHEFVKANIDGLSVAEIAEMYATIARGEMYHGGGGAAGAYLIKREEITGWGANKDPFNKQVLALLATRGVAASWEVPGYIHVPLVRGHSLAIGDANGPWNVDVLREDGYPVDLSGSLELPVSATAAQVADLIENARRNWNAKLSKGGAL